MENLNLVEEEINEDLNLIFSRYVEKDGIIFKNLRALKKLFLQSEKSLFEIYKKYDGYKIDHTRVSKIDFVEKINIIDDFFASLNISFDLQKILVDGTFDIKTSEKNGQLIMPEKDGYYSKNAEHFCISVYNNGLITDAVVWLHEIIHYRHLNKRNNDIAAHYLTESLAFTYELLFLDYLESRGYTYEAQALRPLEAINLFRNVYECYYAMQIFILFDECGCVSEKNYKELFDKDDYEETIKSYCRIVEKKDISSLIEYSIASVLSFYMYEEYKKDNAFLENIENLCNMPSNKSFQEHLNVIGFTTKDDMGFVNSENIEKIKSAIKAFEKGIDADFMKTEEQEKSI